MSEQDFKGKAALVTGAASGIGAACATLLAARGAVVTLADINIEMAEEVAEKIRSAGGTASAEAVDVTRSETVDALISSAVARHGGLHLAVNCAGIVGKFAPVADMTVEDFRRVVDVNLVGMFASMRAEIPAMIGSGGGVIVNISSAAGFGAFPTMSAYTASKHGVIGLTGAAAREYGGAGIRIVSIAPGAVDTNMLSSGPAELIQGLIDAQIVKRTGRPEEIAELAAFLAGDSAAYITGSTHVIDGGFLAR